MKSAHDPSQFSLRALPYVALDPQWLQECDAFHSDSDSRLVRGAVQMLFAAWANTPAGSIPADYRGISRIVGLSEIEVGENYDALTFGWELRGGRLFHVGMCALAERILEQHGPALQAVCDRSAVIVQDPDQFELVPDAPKEPSRLKGRRCLPSDFKFTAEHRSEMNLKAGVADVEDQDFIFAKFVTHVQAGAIKYTNWDAALLNFAMKENVRNLPSRQRVVPLVQHGNSRLQRFGSAGGQATDHNVEVVNRMLRRTGEATVGGCSA